MLGSNISLYLASIIAAFAVIGLLKVSGVSAILGPLTSVLLTISVIFVILFAGVIIMLGLLRLLDTFRK